MQRFFRLPRRFLRSFSVAVLAVALGLSLWGNVESNELNAELISLNGQILDQNRLLNETVEAMKAELRKSCHGTVPYSSGMTLLPGQTAIVTIPVPGLNQEEADAANERF